MRLADFRRVLVKGFSMSTVNAWELAESILPHAARVLLYGPPGTGKTFTAMRDAIKGGRTLYSVTITEDTPAAELRGHYIPRGGEFVWSDGPVMRAFREGAVLVINEIDHSNADVVSLFHAILDDVASARITLPHGETVTRGAGFRCVASMNGTPDDLPLPLQERFDVKVEIDRPHPAAIAALPEDLRAAAEGTACLMDPERRVSLRAWMAFAALRESVSPTLAAAAVFGVARGPEILQSLAIAAD